MGYSTKINIFHYTDKERYVFFLKEYFSEDDVPELRSWLRRNIKSCYQTIRDKHGWCLRKIALKSKDDAMLFRMRFSDKIEFYNYYDTNEGRFRQA